MKRKALTIQMLHELGGFAQSTKGTMLVARFRNTVLAGEVPSKEDLEAIAHAFEPLEVGFDVKGNDSSKKRNRLVEFGKRLGIDKKQGKKQAPKTAELEKEQISVWFYIKLLDKKINSGKDKKTAAKEALEDTKKKAGVGSDRAMKNRIKRHKEEVPLWESTFYADYMKIKNLPSGKEKEEIMKSDLFQQLDYIYGE